MTKVLVERELLERALRSIQHNVGFTDTINDLTATLAKPAHDVASVPTFPCESCGAFHSYSEVAEAGGYCPQCEADYDERKMFADLLKRYTALAAAPQPQSEGCFACLAVQEAEQNPDTECDACGWAGLRNGKPVAPVQPQSDGVIVPRAIAERMAIDAAQYEHEHAVVNDNVQLWQQPSARLTLTVGDLRTVRALLGGEA